MCGIAGIFNVKNDRKADNNLISKMTEKLAHRGPDASGVFLEGPVALGHRRLSIIDIEGGVQPMHSEDGRFHIVYNGEVYNFKEIREELEKEGCKFRTRSDTEVILKAYIRYGKDSLSKFNGMFSFAIWDTLEKKLLLVRDPIGIKPLYYFWDGKTFAFASEIKALLVIPDNTTSPYIPALINFLAYGHSVSPDTIYPLVKKVRPASFIEVSCNGISHFDYETYKYVSLKEKGVGYEWYKNSISEILKDSVKKQMVSDVPIGSFLSGGIDSSTITALMQKESSFPVKTFTVGFDSDSFYNELDDARGVANYLKTDHHELIVKPEILPDILQKLVYHYDEPYGDAAALPTYLVSKFAREHVKVTLSGEGSDELFGGYRRYIAENFRYNSLSILPDFVWSAFKTIASLFPRFRRIKKIVSAFEIDDFIKRYSYFLTVFDLTFQKKLLKPEVLEAAGDYNIFRCYEENYVQEHTCHLNQVMYFDQKTWLVDGYLEKVDKASMAAGLECRVPFLDIRLVSLTAAMPPKYKINGFKTKIILKDIAGNLLPESVIRKSKHGFSVPTDPWFRGSLRGFVEEVLFDPSAEWKKYFVEKSVKEIFYKHINGKEVYDTHLWLLLNFELWNRTFCR